MQQLREKHLVRDLIQAVYKATDYLTQEETDVFALPSVNNNKINPKILMTAYTTLSNLDDTVRLSSEDTQYSDLEYLPSATETLITDINDTNSLLQFLIDIKSGRQLDFIGRRVLENDNRVVRRTDINKNAYDLS